MELHSIIAALASGSSACPDSNSVPDGAGLQLAPASTDDNPGIVPEDSQAQEPVLAIIISDPSASISVSASSTPTSSPPKKKSKMKARSHKCCHEKRKHEATAAALLSGCASPADLTCAQSLFNKQATPALVLSGIVTSPSASDLVTLPPTVPNTQPDSEAKHCHYCSWHKCPHENSPNPATSGPGPVVQCACISQLHLTGQWCCLAPVCMRCTAGVPGSRGSSSCKSGERPARVPLLGS